MLETAEVRGGTQWETRWEIISAKEALRLNPWTIIRYPECHGQVRGSKGGMRGPRFVQVKRHDGCSVAEGFDGTPRVHPDALE